MLAQHGGTPNLMPVEQEKAEDFGSSQHHDPIMVASTDRGEPITANLFIFIRCAAEDARFWCLKGMFDG